MTEKEKFAAAFTEWTKRQVNDPDGFAPILDLVEDSSFDEVGAACAEYFEELLAEVGSV